MAGVEGADTGLEFLAVAAGMHDIADIVMAKDGQRCGRVADPVVGLPQGFGPQEVVGHGSQGVVADIGYLTHSGDAHVGAPGNQTGDQGGYIR